MQQFKTKTYLKTKPNHTKSKPPTTNQICAFNLKKLISHYRNFMGVIRPFHETIYSVRLFVVIRWSFLTLFIVSRKYIKKRFHFIKYRLSGHRYEQILIQIQTRNLKLKTFQFKYLYELWQLQLVFSPLRRRPIWSAAILAIDIDNSPNNSSQLNPHSHQELTSLTSVAADHSRQYLNLHSQQL